MLFMENAVSAATFAAAFDIQAFHRYAKLCRGLSMQLARLCAPAKRPTVSLLSIAVSAGQPAAFKGWKWRRNEHAVPQGSTDDSSGGGPGNLSNPAGLDPSFPGSKPSSAVTSCCRGSSGAAGPTTHP